MVDFGSIRGAFFERWLSLVAVVSKASTGNVLQTAILRAMGVQVQGPVSFMPGASFIWAHHLRLGRYVRVGANARFVCWDPISIGDDFMASDGLTLNSGTHDPETAALIFSPIRIGNRVWCGTNVTVCAGVTIGDDVVIGAGAVVVRDLPGGCVAAGVPAKPIRELRRTAETPIWSSWPERSADKRYMESSKFRQLLFRLRTQF